MNFTLIDKKNWARREYFDHYFTDVPCTYSMTVKLDITAIRAKKQKLYPTMLYWLSVIVNRHEEFRTAIDENGNLGIYSELLPSYTVFRKDTQTFSLLWTKFCADYGDFCAAYEKDQTDFASAHGLIGKPDLPPNNFSVSMIPWTSFEGFHLELQKGYGYLAPIFTMGKFYEENGRTILPLAIQVHHAVCDGFHVCRFIEELQTAING